MMPFNNILRKYPGGYRLHKAQKVNLLMCKDDIKLFAKNEKELKTLIKAVRIYREDIGMEFDMEKRSRLIMKSEKRHMIEEIELRRKIRTLGEK